MSDIKDDTEKKPLGLGESNPVRPKKLELKKTVESGQVRQSFSHGRSKLVQVEVRKKRTYATGESGRLQEVKADAEVPAEQLALEAAHVPAAQHGPLTSGEKAARARALVDAAQRAAEAPLVEAIRAQEVAEAAEQAEHAPAAKPSSEEESARRQAEEAETRRREEQAKLAAAHAVAKLQAVAEEGEGEDDKPRRPGAPAAPKRPVPARGREEPRRRAGKITIAEALGDGEERMRSLASYRRAREKQKAREMALAEPQKFVRNIVIPETITVQELANRMAERAAAVIKSLMNMGVMATITESIDGDTAELVVAEFGHKPVRVSESDVEIGMAGKEDEDTHLLSRPPVVTVMGHVDHGKTSLLDAIRKTDVAAHEAGGITQHIGAYQVTDAAGRKITFIDTPGHAAFTEMRARGAKITDIVVLTVAADDGIMPQTVEAIHHARAAGVPIVVAINKIDKPGANPQRIRTDLLQHELVTEELGGDVLAIEVSAKTGHNLDKLEEAILLQAEILDLKANPDRAAQGAVIEAKMERGRGAVATVLVQKGTLKVGD
ncbi:MAG: translation initiation factor IF-2 N-terminal domain-containing protein, partial [Pseudomonadota bacterium]